MRLLLTLFTFTLLCAAQSNEPLRLEKTIPLPDVQGRIDHMSIDVKNHRLFMAALGNNTVEVIDTEEGKRIHTIPGLHEPQGVLYLPEANRLYIANGGDGTLRIFDGSSYELIKSIKLGEDADNVRFDATKKQVYVGYGTGALAVMNEDGTKVAEINLDAHPESFQLEKNGPRLFVNLPKSRKVAVVDRTKGSVVATWSTGAAFSNYPMALDEHDQRLFIVCRLPARLLVLDTNTGKIIQKLPVIGDSDDVFYDSARKRIYATGGEGGISVYQQDDTDHYRETAKLPTAKGARTSFFSSDLRQLFVAVRRQGAEPASIRVYSAQ
ncbi:MAG TPA: YncE family protein [Bryobacteraceae bacterium]|nr:YncE family protein [Acidobacteriaceae bacterium]